MPLVPAAPFAVAVAVKREKSWQGEVAVAVAHVGWTLVITSAAAAVILMVGFASGC
jgi:hypothetical protein